MSSAKTANRRSTRGEYIETDTGNKVSRRARIEGTAHIILAGRVVVSADVHLRGDLVRPADPPAAAADAAAKSASRTSISVGRYSVLAPGAVLHPPERVYRGEVVYYPLKIGEHTYVGPGAVVAAASIGSYVWIGARSVVGNGVVIRDGVRVLEGSVLPAGMVVPSGVVVGGAPARVLGDVEEGWGVLGGGAREGEWVPGGELREFVRSVR